jgi:hypothetical protein
MSRVLAMLLLLCSVALAAPTDRPWAAGVSEEDQQRALGIFKEGNTLFAELQHAEALAKYREALKVWNHPAIRYNAAVALINLDKPLDAMEELESSLRFGEAPLGAETYKQALIYKKLLSGQLAELDVTCDEPGAEVVLDGAPLFVAPGKTSRRLLPGAHSLVARKNGFLTETRSLQLVPGHLSSETVKLQNLSTLPTHTVRRWALWKPWTVFAAGVAVALIGLPLILDAKSNFDTFDSEISRLCPNGCSSSQLPTTVLEADSRARAENAAAIAMFSIGGAAAAAGAVLLILNQPRIEAAPRPAVTVAPALGGGSFGLTAKISY